MVKQRPATSKLESKLTKQEDELCDRLEKLVVEEQRAKQRIRQLKESVKSMEDGC